MALLALLHGRVGRTLLRSLPDYLQWIFGSERERPLVLYRMRSLFSLQLSDIGMRSPGLLRLVAALREQTQLYLLDISYNNFTLRGTRALLHSLKDPSFLPSLTVLMMRETMALDGEPEDAWDEHVAEFEEFEASGRASRMTFFNQG